MNKPTVAELLLGESIEVSRRYARVSSEFNNIIPRPVMPGQEILLWVVDPETLGLDLRHGIEVWGEFVWQT